MVNCPYYYFIFQMRKKIQLISNFLYKLNKFPFMQPYMFIKSTWWKKLYNSFFKSFG